MTITITDPAVLDALKGGAEGLECVDAEGRFLGTFIAGGLFRPPPGFRSKFSLEDIERERSDPRPGRSLKAILKDFEPARDVRCGMETAG